MQTSGRLHDRDLLDALEALAVEPFSGDVWRTTFASRDPLVGSAAGGRWHPEGSFEALYTSLEEDGALAEIYFHLSRAPVFTSAPMRINRLNATTRRTLKLPDWGALGPLGVDEAKYRSIVQPRAQEIGAAARFLECDGLLVPSPRWPCPNLVLFLDRLDPDEALSLVDSRDVNWPAWKEQRARLVEFGET